MSSRATAPSSCQAAHANPVLPPPHLIAQENRQCQAVPSSARLAFRFRLPRKGQPPSSKTTGCAKAIPPPPTPAPPPRSPTRAQQSRQCWAVPRRCPAPLAAKQAETGWSVSPAQCPLIGCFHSRAVCRAVPGEPMQCQAVFLTLCFCASCYCPSVIEMPSLAWLTWRF